MSKGKKNIKKRTLYQKIVNVFIGIFIAFLFLVFLFFGISQTSTFREYLRKTAVEKINNSVNGKISIEKIDGTLFTSLFLRNTKFVTGKDTILNVKKIELKTSPLQLLFKKIVIRKIELSDANIEFVTDSTGQSSLSTVLSSKPSVIDSSNNVKPFPFIIEISNAGLKNVNFSYHKKNIHNVKAVYDTLNINNIYLKKINTTFNVNADINRNVYEITINNFSAIPNIASFNIKNLTGDFRIDNSKININNFSLLTKNSDIKLVGSIKKKNLFKILSNNKVGSILGNIQLKSKNINLSEIGIFLPSVKQIDGNIALKLNATGKLNNIKVNNLQLRTEGLHLHIIGNITDLVGPNDYKINAIISNSFINENLIAQNFTFLNLPHYENISELKIDTLKFEGNPNKYISSFNMNIIDGNIKGRAQILLKDIRDSYFLNLNTTNVDLSPILNIDSKLNSQINIVGTGYDFKNMNANIDINADGSTYNKKYYKKFNLISIIKNGIADYKLSAATDSTEITSDGKIKNQKENGIAFTIKSNVNKLNLIDFIKGSDISTNLNLTLKSDGNYFSDKKFQIKNNLALNRSVINKTIFKKNNFIFNISNKNNGLLNVDLKSEQINANIQGRFNTASTIDVLTKEINVLSDLINNEVNKLTFNNSKKTSDLTFSNSIDTQLITNLSLKDSLKFFFTFNNFNTHSPFADDDNLSLNGKLNGNIILKNDYVKIKVKSNLDYFKIWGKDRVYFISSLKMNFDIANKVNIRLLADLNTDIKITTKRIFTGNDIRNIDFSYFQKNKTANFIVKATDNKVKLSVEGNSLFNENTTDITIPKFDVYFKKYNIKNSGDIKLSFSNEIINFKHLSLIHNKGAISVNGLLNQVGKNKLKLEIKNINVQDIAENVVDEKKLRNIKGRINLVANLKGTYQNPIIDLRMDVDKFSVSNDLIGNLKTKINYLNKNLGFALSIRNENKNIIIKDKLKINGNIPLDLTLNKKDDALIIDKNAKIKLIANKFNLIALSNFIPELINIKGKLDANLLLEGKIDNLLPTGRASVKDIAFISKTNNLKYIAELKINANKGNILLDSLYLANTNETIDGGVLTGKGSVLIKNYELLNPKINLNGKLKILSKTSKTVSPLVYGDLIVGTIGQLEFSKNKLKGNLKGHLVVNRADITFTQAKSTFNKGFNNFIYKFVKDSSQKALQDSSSFENLIKLASIKKDEKTNIKNDEDNIKYDINIDVEDEAIITFVLDKEFNQVLTAVVNGNFQYKTIGGRSRTFGTFTLMDGSSLEFLTKTFDASGTVKFENEISNPYLDVVGIYKSIYYEPSTDSTGIGTQEKEVAVKIKLKGPLQDLNKAFVKTKNNLAVYYGSDNILKDIPDPTKDASDAIMFIVTGNFANTGEGYTNLNRSNALTGTASSLAGSFLGGLLNSYAGDYIRSVEVRKVGAYTKFSLSGKVKKFRYTIGGTTDVFQDLGKTNIKVEYPFFHKLFFRVERKESLSETNVVRQMINEIGIKYKFEF